MDALTRVDIRAKIVVFVAVMVALFVFSDPWWNLGLLVLMAVVLLAARLPLGGLWLMVQPLLIVFALIVLLTTVSPQRLATPGLDQPWFTVGPFVGTVGGLLVGVNFVVRILLMVLITYAFTATTPIDDILLVMNQVRAPYWLSILVTTSITFIPTMGRKKDLILEAQRARGSRSSGKGALGGLIAVVPIMVPLMTNSILMAENLAVAMTNRGYGASNSMTTLRDLRFTRGDIAIIAVTVVALAGVIALRVAGRGVL